MVCLLQVCAYFAKSYVEGKHAPEVMTMTQEEAEVYLAQHPEAVVEEDVSPLPEQSQNAIIPSKETRQEEAPAKDAPIVLTLTADTLRTALSIAIPAVSVVLLLAIIIPLVRLRLMMRKKTNEGAHSDGNILHAAWIQTPFSFGRTIFLPVGRTPDEERLFILHAIEFCLFFLDFSQRAHPLPKNSCGLNAVAGPFCKPRAEVRVMHTFYISAHLSSLLVARKTCF